MKIIKTNLIVLLVSPLLLFMGCDDNITNSPPVSGTITGVVTFQFPEGEAWPDTGQVSIGLYLTWPPTVPADTTNIEFIELNVSNEYNYTFENVVFETYGGIAVTWRDPSDESPYTRDHILGTYGGAYNYFTAYGGTDPSEITVSTILYELTEINFSANLKYVVACSKLDNQNDCEERDYCTWYPSGTMPGQDTDQCM